LDAIIQSGCGHTITHGKMGGIIDKVETGWAVYDSKANKINYSLLEEAIVAF